MSIAARSFDKAIAKQQSECADEENIPMTDMTEYKLMLGKIRIDLRRLKMINATQKKSELKRDELLPQYKSYIEGVLEAASGKQDDVLMHNLVWLIDVNEFDRAIEIAGYAIDHEIVMAGRFEERDVADLLIEYICNALLRKPDELPGHADLLKRLHELSRNSDLHDAVTVKINKSLALSIQESQPEFALELFKKVYALDPRSGVVKMIARLEKQLSTSTAESS